MEYLPESFTSLSKSHEPHLACVSLFLNFVHSISQKAGVWFHKKSGGVVFVAS